METLYPYLGPLEPFVRDGVALALGWLLSPAAWVQFGLLLASWFGALAITRLLRPRLTALLGPGGRPVLAGPKRFAALFLPLMTPVFAFVLATLGEQATRAMFDAVPVLAFGKRVFLFLAVRAVVRDILTDPFLGLLGRFIVVPAAALYALGLLDPVTARLEATTVPLGNLSFDLLWLIRFIFVAGVVFWLGRWSNDRSTAAIVAKDEMAPATRQLAAKAAEIAIFGAAFLILMNVMGINLASLAVLGGAIGVGLGFGLQKIASNFASGVILLLEGQATVGDYVELDGGEAGTIVRMMSRAAILETFDGRWIVVPNEDFIVTRVVNYSDQGSANRYEAPFSVAYETDINRVPAIVEAAISALPFALQEPFPPDCELRGFGESGVDFAVEFWVNGIDDGPNRYVSDALFAVWNALRDEGIEIPYPRRVLELRGGLGELSGAADGAA
ncbi:MAG: mechanosensitive ion channel family protein [Paracoccaceae bacterium]